jgi:hypothetical protein
MSQAQFSCCCTCLLAEWHAALRQIEAQVLRECRRNFKNDAPLKRAGRDGDRPHKTYLKPQHLPGGTVQLKIIKSSTCYRSMFLCLSRNMGVSLKEKVIIRPPKFILLASAAVLAFYLFDMHWGGVLALLLGPAVW